VESGAVVSLVHCLEEFDPGVKEAAAWALGYIARHSPGKTPFNFRTCSANCRCRSCSSFGSMCSRTRN